MREDNVYKEKRREKVRAGEQQAQTMLQTQEKKSSLYYNFNILISKP